MLKSCQSHLHPLLKFCEWLLNALFSMGIKFAIWRILPINHASTGSLIVFQGLQAIGLFILPSLAAAYLWSDKPLEWLHLRDVTTQQSAINGQPSTISKQQSTFCRLDARLVLLSIGIVVSAIPLINCMVAWNSQLRLPKSMSGIEQLMQEMERQAEQLLQGFMTYKNGAWQILLLNLFVMAVLPGIGEELTFRGVLQGLLVGNQPSVISNQQSGISNKPSVVSRRQHLAVWVTAIVFSFVHFQFYGFVPRLFIGALLGYVLIWSGRIGYSMIMHITNNALSVLVFYFGTYVWNISQSEIDAIGTAGTWWLTLVCTPLMIGLIYLYRRRARTIADVR